MIQHISHQRHAARRRNCKSRVTAVLSSQFFKRMTRRMPFIPAASLSPLFLPGPARAARSLRGQRSPPAARPDRFSRGGHRRDGGRSGDGEGRGRTAGRTCECCVGRQDCGHCRVMLFTCGVTGIRHGSSSCEVASSEAERSASQATARLYLAMASLQTGQC